MSLAFFFFFFSTNAARGHSVLPRWRSPSSFQALLLRSDPFSASSLAHTSGLAQKREEKERRMDSKSARKVASPHRGPEKSGSKRASKQRRAGNLFSFVRFLRGHASSLSSHPLSSPSLCRNIAS